MDTSELESDWAYLTMNPNNNEKDEVLNTEETKQPPECTVSGEEPVKETIIPPKDEVIVGDVNNLECTSKPSEFDEKIESSPSSDSSLSSDVDVIDESSDSNVAAFEASYSSHSSAFSFSGPFSIISEPSPCCGLKDSAENTESNAEVKSSEGIPPSGIKYPTKKEKGCNKRIFKSPSIDHSLNTLSEALSLQQLSPNLKMKNGKAEKLGRALVKKPQKSSVKRPVSTTKPSSAACKRAYIKSPSCDCEKPLTRALLIDVLIMFVIGTITSSFYSFFFFSQVIGNDSGAKPYSVTTDLELFRDDVLKCLGLQHLKALEDKDMELLLQNVCVDNPDAWHKKFPRLVNSTSVKLNLLEMFNSAQDSTKATKPIDSDTEYANLSQVELVIRQMNYFKILPTENKSESERKINVTELILEKESLQGYLLGQLEEFIDILDVADTDLKVGLKELRSEGKINKNSNSLLSLESQIYKAQMRNAYLRWQLQDIILQFGNQDLSGLNIPPVIQTSDSITDSFKVEELMEKIKFLMFSNEELNKEVTNLKEKNAVLEFDAKNMDESLDSSPKPVFVTGTDSSKSSEAEKVDINIDFKKTMEEVHDILQKKLPPGFRESHKWNEFYTRFFEELRMFTENNPNDQWSWEDTKGRITDILFQASTVFEKFGTIETFDVSAALDKYIGEGRKSVDDLLHSVSNFLKIAQAKGDELFRNILPRLKVDFSADSVENIYEALQAKWESMKMKFDQNNLYWGSLDTEPKKIVNNAPFNSNKKDPNVDSPNNDEKYTVFSYNDDKTPLFDVPDDGHKVQDDDAAYQTGEHTPTQLEIDWFLKRALHRANIREREGRPNWYLLRGFNKWRSEGKKGHHDARKEL